MLKLPVILAAGVWRGGSADPGISPRAGLQLRARVLATPAVRRFLGAAPLLRRRLRLARRLTLVAAPRRVPPAPETRDVRAQIGAAGAAATASGAAAAAAGGCAFGRVDGRLAPLAHFGRGRRRRRVGRAAPRQAARKVGQRFAPRQFLGAAAPRRPRVEVALAQADAHAAAPLAQDVRQLRQR